MTDTVLGRVADLKTTPTPELKRQWRGLFGTEPPTYNRRVPAVPAARHRESKGRMGVDLHRPQPDQARPRRLSRVDFTQIVRTQSYLDRLLGQRPLGQRPSGVAILRLYWMRPSGRSAEPRENNPRQISGDRALRAALLAWAALNDARLLR
jgi:hypothetical protein